MPDFAIQPQTQQKMQEPRRMKSKPLVTVNPPGARPSQSRFGAERAKYNALRKLEAACNTRAQKLMSYYAETQIRARAKRAQESGKSAHDYPEVKAKQLEKVQAGLDQERIGEETGRLIADESPVGHITEKNITVAVGVGVDSDGQKVTLIATNKGLAKSTLLPYLGAGETWVEAPEGMSKLDEWETHAERLILAWAKGRGIKLITIAASSNICPHCAQPVAESGATMANELKKGGSPGADATGNLGQAMELAGQLEAKTPSEASKEAPNEKSEGPELVPDDKLGTGVKASDSPPREQLRQLGSEREGEMRYQKDTYEPFKMPIEQSDIPAGGGAAEGIAQLLIEAEQIAQVVADERSWKRAASLRTYAWWTERGVRIPAWLIKDRWLRKDVTVDLKKSLKNVSLQEVAGTVVGRLPADQLANFARWLETNVKSWPQFYANFIGDEDAGVLWYDGDVRVLSWAWGDWWPANVYRVEIPDGAVAKLLSGTLSRITQRPPLADTQKEGAGRTFTLGRTLRFSRRPWTDKRLFSPLDVDQMVGLLDHTGLFREIATSDVPAGYTLVTGADWPTYQYFYDLRARYAPAPGGAVLMDADVMRSGTQQSNVGWQGVSVPCVLVKAESVVTGD